MHLLLLVWSERVRAGGAHWDRLRCLGGFRCWHLRYGPQYTLDGCWVTGESLHGLPGSATGCGSWNNRLTTIPSCLSCRSGRFICINSDQIRPMLS
jgi:hypothetical protein